MRNVFATIATPRLLPCARAYNLQHRLNELATVLTFPAAVAVIARQKRDDPFPLGIVQQQANQGWPPIFRP